MTDFVRIPAKIFAENASPVGNDPQIGKFGNAKQGIYTGVSDVQEIQNSEAWSQGWTSAVVSAMNFPPLPEMNGVLKVLSYQICYLLQKGIPEWNADTVYYTNDYVNYNGKLYYSSIDNNTFEPETRGAGNSWLSGTSDVAIATNETNGISRPDGETVYVDEDGILHSPKWNLFDIIPKDHKLTFEESEGLELLGEYVYKEAQDGRYGYPDFYNKCLEEYQEEDNTEEVIGYENMTFNGNLTIENDWASNFSNDNFIEIPAPSEEINSFRIECEFTLPQEISKLQAVYGQKITNITSPQLQLNYNGNESIGFNVPEPNEEGAGKWGDGVAINIPYILGATYKTIYEYKDGQVKASVKEASGEWQEYGPKDLAGVFWSEPLCFGKDYDIFFGGKLNLSSIKIEVNDKFYAGAVKAKINPNGHKYYDIQYKAKIDEIYEKTGIAWYYGIDEENQRIFLPRKTGVYVVDKKEPTKEDPTWYRLYSDGWVEQGGITPAEITAKIDFPIEFKNTEYYYNILESGLDTDYSSGSTQTRYDLRTTSSITTYKYSKNISSWIAEGYTALAINHNYYEYMAVGNVSIEKYNTEITEVTTSENDTLPLFTGMYFDFKPNHISWLKAGTEANGQIYPSAYNELVKVSRGEETKYGEGFKVIKEADKLPDIDYSKYWIVNEDTLTFKTPSKSIEEITQSENNGLYFKVANAVENLELLNAGEAMEALNNAVNKTECKAYIIDTYTNGNSGYRVYSNGYCEQWGYVETNKTSAVNTVSFLKTYKDSNYFFIQAQYSQGDDYIQRVQNKLPASIQVTGQNDSIGFNWLAMGYLSEGTY